MIGAIKRSWFKAQALTCLQTGYEMPLKEPLSKDDNLCLKEACAIVTNMGGNPWDAAALYMLAAADARLKASPRHLNEADEELLAKAVGTTLGVAHLQKKPKIWLERVRLLAELYKAHPDHPSQVAGRSDGGTA